MSAHYVQLLDAAIRHLEELRVRGSQFVPLSSKGSACIESLLRPGLSSDDLLAPRTTSSNVPVKNADRSASVDEPVKECAVAEAASPLARPVVVDRTPKVEAMAELRTRALICRKCPHLAASRKSVVFGVGDIESPLMFIGEAPGADEDEQGEPFVGKAGQLLTRIIKAMGFSREAVYIANILKCRPDTPAQASGNRKPTPEEMKTCQPYLLVQIDLIQPKVLVALGATAVEGLLGTTIGITRLRGRWQSFRGIPLMPTYHPAYLLRNESLAVKREVWEDMLQVMEKLGVAITEKQRKYFLRS